MQRPRHESVVQRLFVPQKHQHGVGPEPQRYPSHLRLLNTPYTAVERLSTRPEEVIRGQEDLLQGLAATLRLRGDQFLDLLHRF